MRVPEVADRLGVGASRAYQMIAAGIIPACRYGRAVRVPRAAFARWLADQSDAALAAVRRG